MNCNDCSTFDGGSLNFSTSGPRSVASAEAKAIRGAIRTLGGPCSTNYAKIERRLAYIEGCIPTYKEQILAYVSRTPSASRSEVVRKKRTACTYARYDPAWYQEVVHRRGVRPPQIAPRHGPTSITSARQIAQDDERASRSIRAAYNDLLAFDGSPSQITKTALLRQARLDRALTRLRRFSKTLKLIQECIETGAVFSATATLGSARIAAGWILYPQETDDHGLLQHPLHLPL